MVSGDKSITSRLHQKGTLTAAESEIQNLIKEISKAKKIVVCGAGRVGMATRGFGMRLGHLGLKAYTLGDSTVPSIEKGEERSHVGDNSAPFHQQEHRTND